MEIIMKNAIVTGATGFIGSWVVKELIKQNVHVTVIVRNTYKDETLFNDQVKVIYCNMDNYNNLPELLDCDYDVIYHFAWDGVSGEKIMSDEIQILNMKSTLDLIKILPQIGCKRFVGAGSLHEIESFYEMQENKPISNLSYMYKGTKLAAHWMGKALAGSMGIDFFWPVITNAYGEGENSKRLVNSVVRSILHGVKMEVSEGKQYYDFLHISDVAHAFFLIGEKGIDGTNYIIGSGDAKPLRKYLEIIERTTNEINGSNIKLNYGKKTNNVVCLPPNTFDISSLVNHTGFCPQVRFDEGILRTIKWIKEN